MFCIIYEAATYCPCVSREIYYGGATFRDVALRVNQIRYRILPCFQCGDSLVFIFPLAPMLTFTSAVGKLNVRVLWHHRMLLQVISQSYCQVFVKSYNFVFEKIDKEGSPREK